MRAKYVEISHLINRNHAAVVPIDGRRTGVCLMGVFLRQQIDTLLLDYQSIGLQHLAFNYQCPATSSLKKAGGLST